MSSLLDISYVRVADVPDAVLARARRELTPDEERRCAAFAFDELRREYLATRALAAHALAGWSEAPLAFVRSRHGKPELWPASDVRFNLTNTRSLVACAVVRGRVVGIDAEPLARAGDILEIASTIFTPAERRGLDALAAEEGDRQQHRAVALWTFKEAYMKARGTGLSLEPDRVDIRGLDGDGALRVAEVPGRWRARAENESIGEPLCAVRDESWELHAWTVADHVLAVCVERGGPSLATCSPRPVVLA